MKQLEPSDIKAARNLDRQIAAVMATIAASVIVIVTLQGTKDRLLDIFPNKNYDYLEKLPKISSMIFVFTSLFYVYDTWRQCRETPGQRSLSFLLAANSLAMVAAAVKFELVCERKPGETAKRQAAQSTELEEG